MALYHFKIKFCIELPLHFFMPYFSQLWLKNVHLLKKKEEIVFIYIILPLRFGMMVLHALM